MTLDDTEWSGYFDSLTAGGDLLRATVTLARVRLAPVRAYGAARGGVLDAFARVPLSPVRARRGDNEGVLDGIRYNRSSDELEVRIRQGPDRPVWRRYFVPAPRAVTVEEREEGRVICVTDAGGLRTVITLVSVLCDVAQQTEREHRHSAL
jgi:hypothetical protein